MPIIKNAKRLLTSKGFLRQFNIKTNGNYLERRFDRSSVILNSNVENKISIDIGPIRNSGQIL